MATGIKVPRLDKGKGFKGPDFYGCMNTGTAPAIFHSRTGKYVVGPESAAREAMSEGICLTNKRCYGKDRRKVWIFKGEILEHDPMAQDKKMAEQDHSGGGGERRRRDRDAA